MKKIDSEQRKRKHPSEITSEIVEYLATHRPSNPYEIWTGINSGSSNKPKYSYSVIYNWFENHNQFVYTLDPYRKHGKGETKPYSLRTYTMLELLFPKEPHPLSDKIWNRIDEVAANNKHLSNLWFGLYSEYKKDGLDKIIYEKIRTISAPFELSSLIQQAYHTIAKIGTEAERERVYGKMIDRAFIEAVMSLSKPIFSKVLDVLARHPDELREFCDELRLEHILTLKRFKKLDSHYKQAIQHLPDINNKYKPSREFAIKIIKELLLDHSTQ